MYISKNLLIFVIQKMNKFNNFIMQKHVQVPDPKTTGTNLKPFDYLVYANIRRYVNKETMTAFPSLKTIAKNCDSTIPTIRTSIKRLLQEGMFTVISSAGKSSIYKFDRLDDNFERFTPEFLDRTDLSADEKAYIIGLQAKSYKTEDYAVTTYSNQQLSKELHLSMSSINRLNKSLAEKEVMKEITSSLIDETGLPTTAKAVDLHKIGQAILFVNARVDNHEERISNLEKLLDLASKENRKLLNENNLLRKENLKLSSKEGEF